jgi:ABC-type phosphonate transport system ATPase subunit
MDMNIIQSAATEVLVNLSLAVISLAGAYAVYYIRLGASKLKAQTAQIEDESARKVLDNALADVENLATKSVGAMEQTTAKALRDAVKSGAANREDLLALGKQVFNEVKAAIAPEAQKVITDNLGSFDDYLTKCIEDAVLKVKQSDPFITLPEGVMLEGDTVTEEAAPSSEE